LRALEQRKISVKLRHTCNSGGFLDLPHAHLDMVRVGILIVRRFSVAVCRQIPGIEPVMSVKARIAAIQKLKPGEVVGYGMRYTAPIERRIAVLPIGYGDGFPRVRNEGGALIHGRRAPLIGGIAMDALMVDITDIPAGADVGRSRHHGPAGRRGNHRARHRQAEKLRELRRADQLAAALRRKIGESAGPSKSRRITHD
jgi:alanine racemase